MITKTLRKKIPGFNIPVMLIHGGYGTGKTTFASQFEKPYFLMFENNDDYQDTLYHDNIDSFDKLKVICKELVETQHDFKYVVFDNIDKMCELVETDFIVKYNDVQVREADKIKALTDILFGIAHKAVEQNIMKVINPILMCKQLKVIFIAHTETRSYKTFTGDSFNELVPEISFKRIRKYFFTTSPVIFYYFYSGKDRYLKIIGNDFVMAKHRVKYHFLTDKGEKVINIPMPKDEKESYKYFMAAYNNKLKNTYKHIK